MRGRKGKKKSVSTSRKIVLILVVICCTLGVFWAAGNFLGYFSNDDIRNISIRTITRRIGTEPQQDAYGNINVLLVGIGGSGHAGGYLADSIILASFDTKNNSLSMLSIPRDLYVVESKIPGKINSVFSRGYVRGDKSIASGAVLLKSKVEEITDITIPYFAVVDFNGFEKFIDAIGGININVPETIYDQLYPISEEGDGQYGTFYIQAGPHTLDGATALKYARSRHSSSDFSRSLRQQQIIDAVKNRILGGGISVSKIKDYYTSYQEMVTTNFSLQETLGMIKYVDKKDIAMSSFGLNVYYSVTNFQRTDPGSFLYYPKREDFGGAAVILPMGAYAGNVSFYEYIHDFAKIVLHDQRYLSEKPKIIIKNAIDKEFARKNNVSPSGRANKLAVKLKRYGFDIQEISNAEISLDTSTIVLPGTGNIQYSGTVDILHNFFIPRGDIVPAFETGSTNFEIILGNDFITQVVNSGFDNNAL